LTRWCPEFGPPPAKGRVVIGNAHKRKTGCVVEKRQIGLKNAVGETVVVIGQRQKLFPNMSAIGCIEVADTADLIGRGAGFDSALGN